MAIAFEGDITSPGMPSLLESGLDVFTARIEVRDGEAVVGLIGEFDMASAKWLAARLDQLAPRPNRYVFDLSQVTFIDSYGGLTLVERANGSPCSLAITDRPSVPPTSGIGAVHPRRRAGGRSGSAGGGSPLQQLRESLELREMGLRSG